MKMKTTILSVAALIVLFMNACTQRKGGTGSRGETAVADSDTISYLEAKKYVTNYGPRAGIVKRVSTNENKLMWTRFLIHAVYGSVSTD